MTIPSSRSNKSEISPPRIPLSALLYSATWMRIVCCYAPWLVYPMMRDARRDASYCMWWLRLYAALYFAELRRLEMTVPMTIKIETR